MKRKSKDTHQIIKSEKVLGSKRQKTNEDGDYIMHQKIMSVVSKCEESEKKVKMVMQTLCDKMQKMINYDYDDSEEVEDLEDSSSEEEKEELVEDQRSESMIIESRRQSSTRISRVHQNVTTTTGFEEVEQIPIQDVDAQDKAVSEKSSVGAVSLVPQGSPDDFKQVKRKRSAGKRIHLDKVQDIDSKTFSEPSIEINQYQEKQKPPVTTEIYLKNLKTFNRQKADQTPIQWAIDLENMEIDESEGDIKSVSELSFQMMDRDQIFRKAIFANRGKKFGRFTDEQLILLTDSKYLKINDGNSMPEKVAYFKKHHGLFKSKCSNNANIFMLRAIYKFYDEQMQLFKKNPNMKAQKSVSQIKQTLEAKQLNSIKK